MFLNMDNYKVNMYLYIIYNLYTFKELSIFTFFLLLLRFDYAAQFFYFNFIFIYEINFPFVIQISFILL